MIDSKKHTVFTINDAFVLFQYDIGVFNDLILKSLRFSILHFLFIVIFTKITFTNI